MTRSAGCIRRPALWRRRAVVGRDSLAGEYDTGSGSFTQICTGPSGDDPLVLFGQRAISGGGRARLGGGGTRRCRAGWRAQV